MTNLYLINLLLAIIALLFLSVAFLFFYNFIITDIHHTEINITINFLLDILKIFIPSLTVYIAYINLKKLIERNTFLNYLDHKKDFLNL